MRIARYSVDDAIHYGVVDLETDGTGHPDTVSDLNGDPLSGPVKLTGVRRALADVRLLAPVLPRSKVIGIAKNSMPGNDNPPPATRGPAVFLKPNTSVIGPGEAIQLPAVSTDPALEGELAIVIGRICRSVPVERVAEVIFGYTITNDVTARDQLGDGPWGLGKCWDTFTPLGPWIVTHLSVEETTNLSIVALVDDEVATTGTTRGLFHGVAALVSFVSGMMTLLPGDVILTGAPGGSAPIRGGQTVTIELDQIGTLTNPVIAES